MGLFGLITFDPFYKTNNTRILHALVAVQLDFGHSQRFANRTRSVNACCTAANA